MQKDNSTLSHKLVLRRRALALCPRPAWVLETHGGWGRIGERVYDGCRGVVIEKTQDKASHLARQRPGWRVYQAVSEAALAAGLASGVAFDLIDLAPYGSPFPVMRALFEHPRELGDSLQLVVNDGLRQKVKLGGAWQVHDLREVVCRRGNDLYDDYLDAARECVEAIVAAAGYRVSHWHGYYTGSHGDMTHYWATLRRGDG